jgi:predicted nuclease of restriction endonuclease-like RecB superfamily
MAFDYDTFKNAMQGRIYEMSESIKTYEICIASLKKDIRGINKIIEETKVFEIIKKPKVKIRKK